MQVDERQAKATTEHKGQTIYFCSPGCKEQFQANPDRYARQSA
jgi:YHS domain-containing protein